MRMSLDGRVAVGEGAPDDEHRVNVRPTDRRGTPGTRTRPWKAARCRDCVARVHLAVMNRLALTAAGVAVLAAFQTRQLPLRDGPTPEFFFPTRGVS